MAKKILILGGGFGGVKAALELCSDKNFEVTLVSNHPDFRYYPALYRSATGGSRRISAIPLSDIFNGHSVSVISDTAVSIDRDKKLVSLQSKKKLPYDTLIIGLGNVTNYFGIKGLEQYSYGIKSIEEAEGLKLHLHQQMMDDNKPDLHYLIVGAGPSGIELAGALPHYLKHIMRQHKMPEKPVKIELIEAADRVMPRMDKSVSRHIAKRLKTLGVSILTNQKVEAETVDSLMVNGKPIKSHTVVWTAGVTNNPFFSANGFTLNDHGRVVVNQYLEAEPDIYVLGDNADTKYTGMAQTALYDALFVSANLKRQIAGKKPKPYEAKRPVYVTPAGPHWAAVIWGPAKIYGRLGSIIRSLADLVAYHDYEPWWQASQLFMAERLEEDLCALCDTPHTK